MTKKKTKKTSKPDSPKRRSRNPEPPTGGPSEENERSAATRPAANGQAVAPDFAIVGVGASAGGLEAFTLLLQALPARPELALVFIQHLAPQHHSALATVLGNATSLPVVQVVDGMTVEKNHIYVMPPNVQMEFRDGKLHLGPRPGDRTQFTPIDFFFRSLARELQNGAIGVVLSGTASDGSDGLREIKAQAGITLAQEPQTARYDGMPLSAVATGMVDMVLPPAELAHELYRIARHPYTRPVEPTPGDEKNEFDGELLARVFELLRAAGGVDFTHYKFPTIRRRLQRRMLLHKVAGLDEYLKVLIENPVEVERLYHDVLIHVTRFFREPDSFEALTKYVFPKLVEDRHDDRPIRIWIPGCSTGEEAYSTAVAMLEFLGDAAGSVPVQIFATDVSEMAVDVARSGLYPQSITDDVSEERIRRFFTKSDGHYRVAKVVRDMCVFARQDLTRDPPFSKLDLIMCRNVLIYLGTVLQKKLMSTFHYALKPDGFLMLGSAETTGAFGDLFTVADKKHRIFNKRAGGALYDPMPRIDYTVERAERTARLPTESRVIGNVYSEAGRLILDKYAPAAVLVDAELQIVHSAATPANISSPPPETPASTCSRWPATACCTGSAPPCMRPAGEM
jgi:two-component system CheB/CheR fusion protein